MGVGEGDRASRAERRIDDSGREIAGLGGQDQVRALVAVALELECDVCKRGAGGAGHIIEDERAAAGYVHGQRCALEAVAGHRGAGEVDGVADDQPGDGAARRGEGRGVVEFQHARAVGEGDRRGCARSELQRGAGADDQLAIADDRARQVERSARGLDLSEIVDRAGYRSVSGQTPLSRR